MLFTYYSDKSHSKSKKEHHHNMRSYKRAVNCSDLH